MKNRLNNKVKTSNPKFRYIFFLISILLLVVSFTYKTVYAESFKEPSFLQDKYEIVDKLGDYSPDLDTYPFDEDDVDAVSMTDLWGDSKSLTKYRGEVPHSLADDNENLWTYNGTTIGGNERPWSTESGLESGDIKPGSSDIHIRAIAEHGGTGTGSIGWIVYQIVVFINFIVTGVLNLLMMLKNLSVDTFFDLLSSGDKLKETVNTLFLISPDGEVSPFLTIMIVIFIISLVGVVFEAIMGNKAFQIAMKELGFLLLAGAIAGLALTSNGQSEIAKWGVNIATSLTNDIVSSGTNDSELFTYDTGNTTKDSKNTQMELLNKPHIDNFIKMQFGENVHNLEIADSNGTYTDNFGSDTEQAVDRTFEGDANFAIDSGNGPVRNLGYYWWAANSSVEEDNPLDNESDSVLESGSNMRYLYIIDFLNNARSNAVDNGEDKVVSKIDNIMNSLTNPDYLSGSWSLLLLSALKIAMLYAFFLIVAFMTIGKVIISVGAFGIPIFANLTLVKKTRPLAKKLLTTYMMGFVRFVVGLLMINFVVSVISILAAQGTGGIIVAIVVTFMLGKFIPKIMMEINRVVASNDSRFMNGINRGFSRYSNSINNNRNSRNKNRIKYDENGDLVQSDESIKGKVATGMSKKGSSNSEETGEGANSQAKAKSPVEKGMNDEQISREDIESHSSENDSNNSETDSKTGYGYKDESSNNSEDSSEDNEDATSRKGNGFDEDDEDKISKDDEDSEDNDDKDDDDNDDDDNDNDEDDDDGDNNGNSSNSNMDNGNSNGFATGAATGAAGAAAYVAYNSESENESDKNSSATSNKDNIENDSEKIEEDDPNKSNNAKSNEESIENDSDSIDKSDENNSNEKSDEDNSNKSSDENKQERRNIRIDRETSNNTNEGNKGTDGNIENPANDEDKESNSSTENSNNKDKGSSNNEKDKNTESNEQKDASSKTTKTDNSNKDNDYSSKKSESSGESENGENKETDKNTRNDTNSKTTSTENSNKDANTGSDKDKTKESEADRERSNKQSNNSEASATEAAATTASTKTQTSSETANDDRSNTRSERKSTNNKEGDKGNKDRNIKINQDKNSNNKNNSKKEFIKRKGKNAGLNLMQKSVHGQKVAQRMKDKSDKNNKD